MHLVTSYVYLCIKSHHTMYVLHVSLFKSVTLSRFFTFISKKSFKQLKSILISEQTLMKHLPFHTEPYSIVHVFHPAVLTQKQTDTRGPVAIRSNAPFLRQSVAGENLGNQAPDIVTCKYQTRECQRYLQQGSV